MRRFVVVLTAWALGLGWALTSVLLPASRASAVLAALSPAVSTGVVTPGGFTSLAPSRLLDTRSGLGAPRGATNAGHTIGLQITGSGGIPDSGVSAVVLTVTVTEPAKSGFVSVYRNGDIPPGTSNLNFVAGRTVANLVIATVGVGGQVALTNGSAGSVQLIADVSGYYLSGPTGVPRVFETLAPSRLLDTRSGVGAPAVAVAAGGTMQLQVGGRGGVPGSGVSAVVLNVTVTAPAKGGFVTAYDPKRDGVSDPNAPATAGIPER